MLTLIDCSSRLGSSGPPGELTCGAQLRVRDDAGSNLMRCPRCGTVYDVADLIHEDSVIREYLKTRVGQADLDAPGSINRTHIVRSRDKVIVSIHSTRGDVLRDEDDEVTDQLAGELQDLTRRRVEVRFKPVNDTNPLLEQFKRKLEDAEDERRMALEVVEGTDPTGKALEPGGLPSPPPTPPRAAVAAPSIFISYRREDSIDATGRLADRLIAHFGRERVFVDVDSIPVGVDFRQFLATAVGRCRVLLAVIGDRWLTCSHEGGPRKGQRRLDDPADFVRIEIEAALQRDISVIPVLVGSAHVPTPQALPPSLQELSYRNAADVRPGRDFNGHVDHLIRGLEQLLGG